MNTTNKTDGGPAFPQGVATGSAADGPICSHDFADSSGMTLRDWFAGQAMFGLMANYANSQSAIDQVERIKVQEGFESASEAISWMAYRYADHMLAIRQKGGDE